MKELIKITDNAVNAMDLYNFLGIKHKFRDWIRNSIRDYGFKVDIDFSYFFSESTGGRPSKDYALSIEMAKELSMVAKTKRGREARKYFIKCEAIAKKSYALRVAGIETRKTLTDKIQESGENERMHGHGYSTYTRLIYSLTGLTETYKEWKIDYPDGKKKFRDYLIPEDLKRIELAEGIIKPLVEMGKQYSEIKETLEPLFKNKTIKEGIK